MRFARALAFAAALLALPAGASADGANPGMILGAQTHFSQGWQLQWFDRAQDIGVANLRDGLAWDAVEKKPGVYDFTPALTRHLEEARKRKIDLLLTLQPNNRNYDGGKTAFSPQARQAYADYISALLDRYGDVVSAIEIGNEVNAANNITGDAAKDRAGAYTAILRDVYATVKPKHPKALILGGSTNVVGSGFLGSLFEKGALQVMDGVVVHPYRSTPENLDWELNNLTAIMKRAGAVKPIYATEFSDQFDRPEQAAPHLLKMVAQMGAAHVARSYWYALADQSFFKNMGLFDEAQRRKPGGDAFAFVQSALMPQGDPVRIEAGDRRTFIYRYGAKTYVMWGAARPLVLDGQVRARDARGQNIPRPTALSGDPIVLDGDFKYSLGQSPVLADSLYEFGAAPWSYFAKTADGKLNPLSVTDWEWTSYLGGRYYKPLRINGDNLAPAGDGAKPIQAVERFTAPRPMKVRVVGSWRPGKGDGVDVHILHNGRELRSNLVTTALRVDDLKVDLAAGDTLDFAVGPNQAVGGDSTAVRIQLMADAGQ